MNKNFDFKKALEQTKARFQGRPKVYQYADKIRTNFFYRRIDPIQAELKHQKSIYATGKIGWGVLVQANEKLFKIQDTPLPAVAIYTHDTNISPNEMAEMAHNLYKLKHTYHSTPEIQRFVNSITDERARIFELKLPASIAGNNFIYFTTIHLDPRHFPNQYLSSPIFPIIKAQKYKALIMLPYWYWSKDFLNQYWN